MKIRLFIKIIAVLTLISGLVQMVFPSFVLKVVGANTDITSAHFFGIVGMFMAIFGGLLLQVTSNSFPQHIPIFWCGLQKVGAALAVPLGVMKGVFSPISLGVAGFDFLSAIIIFIYWNKIRNNRTL